MRAKRKGRDTGLHVLGPEPKDVNVEIVAVHGLGAHPEYTWTHKSASISDGNVEYSRVHLLKDLLMKDERFSQARFLQFSYNSDWLIDAPIESAQEIGVRLVSALSQHRSSHPRVPIIFIGHSFGGIVIKEALSYPTEDSCEIYQDTSGIIFLGTPHNGSPVSGLAAILALSTRLLGSDTSLLLSLRSNETHLGDLSKRFARCLEDKDAKGKKTKIISICEMKPTYILQCLSIGLIVPWHSAATTAGKTIEVLKDHSGLNKCRDSTDPLYIELAQQLCKLQPTTVPELNNVQQAVIDQLTPTAAISAILNYDPENTGEDEDEPECHPGTRSEILDEIYQWLDNDTPSQKHIYWLQGKAGTGKSTISRTVARKLAEEKRLNATFFFNRSENDRNTSKRFFTTLAGQLVAKLPAIANSMKNSISSDPLLLSSGPAVQFKKLISEPLQNLSHKSLKTLVVVVDALDECSTEKDVCVLLKILSRPIFSKDATQKSDSMPLIKVFLTSRPQFMVGPSFINMPVTISNKWDERKLEEATIETTERDLRKFLKFRLGRINGLIEPIPGRDQWSNLEDVRKLEELVQLACPLFIFAATACRFIGQVRLPGGPKERLQQILNQKALSELQRTYLPVLNQLVTELMDEDRGAAIDEFKYIIGSILSLGDPLSISSLSNLLAKPVTNIRKELELLEAVFVVPPQNSIPVKAFHKSFRDFVLGPSCKEFQINQPETHRGLANRCIELLSATLTKDICQLKAPGINPEDLSPQRIESYLSLDVQYACRFWVYHAKESGLKVKDNDQVHYFLQTHLLFWFEALSLSGRLLESSKAIQDLQSIVDPTEGAHVKLFLRDIERFILSFRFIISKAPLQLYNSALVFAPKESLVRQKFSKLSDFSSWIDNPPVVASDWSPCLQSFEGHTIEVKGVAFLENHRLASACDGTIKIWDLASGICLQTIEIHHTDERYSISVAFSTNGKIATSSWGEIKIWDLDQGECLQTAEIAGEVNSMNFLENDKLVAFINPAVLDVWSMEEGRWLQTRWPFDLSEGDPMKALSGLETTTVSADGQWFACEFPIPRTIKILKFGSATIETVTTIQRAPDNVFDLVFSEDCQYLASTSKVSPSERIAVAIWEVASGRCLRATTIDMITRTNCSTFSPNNDLFATAASADTRVTVWGWKNSTEIKNFNGHSEITSLAFSPDGAWLAAGSEKGPIQIWDMCSSLTELPKAHEFGAPSVAFTSNGQRLVSSAVHVFDAPKIWDTSTGACLQAEPSMNVLRRYPYVPHHVAASAKGQALASNNFDGGFSIRDLKTGIRSIVPEKDVGSVVLMAISVDGERLMTGAYRQSNLLSIDIWDTKTCSSIHKFTYGREFSRVFFIDAISSDGRQLAFSLGGETLELWNLSTNEKFDIPVPCASWSSISFSENGDRLGVVVTPSNISVWDTTTGTCLQRYEGIPEPRFSIPWHLDSSFVNVDFTSGTQSLMQSRAACLTNYNISPDGEWVMRQSEKLLWLTPEYRPGHAAIYKSQIAIGSESGNVIILNLSVSDRGE
ncbi:uncharacterized protein Triagg1_6289 [Trichoderma aggressivum f. europaeum]|uniref:Mitochondrial division protein 1 n=1 Tax=Trichoderma aggressivum f. europaeum TaxID=173218 RepID=A0AAE1LZN8_9HYPO|nr:hypothetical protein Triagg1_6289 [Trichoderma aggressivum f. europaeum]